MTSAPTSSSTVSMSLKLPPLANDSPLLPCAQLIVNPRQKGNPILKLIRNVSWAYGETPADYLLSDSACALFLSLRYHQLHPNYLARRLGERQDPRLLSEC